jgi:diguanylate cyclase (GGDEF)-like protein
MSQQILAFFTPPHFEEPVQVRRAELLNRTLLVVFACGLAGLLLNLLWAQWTSTILLTMLLVLLLMAKIILQQRKLPLAASLFLGSLTLTNLLFSALLPTWPLAGVSLALISVISLVLLAFNRTLVVYAFNVVGCLLVSLPNDISQVVRTAWASLAVLLLLLMLHHYFQTRKAQDNDLMHLCEHYAHENDQLTRQLTETTAQLAGEVETRKSLEMRVRDEIHPDESHRFNPQTGIYTEKAMLALIDQEISRTRRYQRPLSLLCIRVDQMMKVVEKAGLTPGKLLSILSDTFNESLRREDVLGHYGDDGFYVILPETGRYASYVVAERLRHLVEVMTLFKDESTSLTISIGLTAYQDQAKMTVETFTQQASIALASAEEHGGNWTISWYDLSQTTV